MKVVYTDRHRLHAPERAFALGRQVPYRDTPERAETILSALQRAGHEVIGPSFDDPRVARALHANDYVDYIASACREWTTAGYTDEGVVGDVFPIRRPARRPSAPSRMAGWYLFDTETPVVEGTFEAAVAAACCAVSGAALLLSGQHCAYALCRPPGHHAGRDYGGGYCYFNNAALAAHRLTGGNGKQRVAILDLDYHHGNGTQDLFYSSEAVLYVSIHADPAEAFPYYWGYPDETGDAAGRGRNLNLVLRPGAGEAAYTEALGRALDAVARFAPAFLVVSLGTDIGEGDPLGGFALSLGALERIGKRVASPGTPALVVQEGGYGLPVMGACVRAFLGGLERGC